MMKSAMESVMTKSTCILGIETSCDETAAAVVRDGTTLLSNIIASQTDLHAKYGGVFPEVASRKHIEVVYSVIEQAMAEADVTYDDLSAIAVTRGPGLVGSLLVGVNTAKGLALATGKPLLGINHIEGHIYSLWLTEQANEIEFPLITLVVSGGHTELYLMTDHLTYEHLGGTMDDAAGEAFDKVGRLLGLPYPGGPIIDKLARTGNPTAFNFPRAVMNDKYGLDFSFSGLKTAVMRQTKRYNNPERMPVADLAASFQTAVVDTLIGKTQQAVEQYNVKAVHLAGGVSANSGLRQAMQTELSVPVRYPPLKLCTDNAAMIASVGHWRLINGHQTTLDFDVHPNLPITSYIK